MKHQLVVKDNNVLFLKSQHLQIPYIEQWKGIVAATHVHLIHIGLQETLNALRSIWSIHIHSHGLSIDLHSHGLSTSDV